MLHHVIIINTFGLETIFPTVVEWRPWCGGLSLQSGKSEIAGSSPVLAFMFQRKKDFSSPTHEDSVL